MSESSPILSLPYLMPSQAQKHVTHNEALRILDAVVQLRLTAFDADTPPADPDPGAAWALGASPTGAWAGQPGRLAIWQGEGWLFLTPQPGWRAWGIGEAESRIWQDGAWAPPPHLGVNTSADAGNRLAVAAPATLLTHEGAGHQLKINKASTADTAAVLFQSNWSGRAEMGLLGHDRFSLKVSGDGSSWTEALRVTAGDGDIGLGISPAARLHAAEPRNSQTVRFDNTHAGFSDAVQTLAVSRGGDAGFDFLRCLSSAGGASDLAFQVRGDGQVLADGAFTGGGADYAEYFEWADGNPGGEDRRGLSVVLEGDRIRPAKAGETPIGVITARPSVLGNGDTGGWRGRYLRDDFGSPLLDTGADGRQSRRLNPAYDPARPYVPRAERPEWAMVGLIGKLRLCRDQPTDAGWIRLRRISPDVEEWLLR